MIERTTMQKRWVFLVVLLAAGLQLIYAARVPFDKSYHDLGSLSDWNTIEYGHLGYIQYLFQYESLPDFCPMDSGQFYHPPLFHIIGAIVLKIFYGTGVICLESAFEILQFINVFFAIVAQFYFVRIVEIMEVRKAKLPVVSFVLLHPCWYNLGTALNNDCLMVMFAMMSLYYLLDYLKRMNTAAIVKIALCFGLGLLAKTSMALLAPGYAVAFVLFFWKHKDCAAKIIMQYLLFGLISVPIGMSWVVRNWFLFRMSPNYVLELSNELPQYISGVSWIRRLGIPSFRQLTSYGIRVDEPINYCNIWGSTFITMVYDEGVLYLPHILEKIVALLTVWLNAGIALLSVGATIIVLIKGRMRLELKGLFSVCYIVLLGSYIMFCFRYPFVCTMNFRYIVMTLILSVIGYGVYIEEKDSHLGRAGIIFNGAISLFTGSCVVLYLIGA